MLTRGIYTIPNATLEVHVLKIYHVSPTYYKTKLMFVNPNTGAVFETKAYTLYKDNITHWIKKKFYE